MKTANAKPFKVFEVDGIQVLYERGFETATDKEVIRTACYIDGLRIETTGSFGVGSKAEKEANKNFESVAQLTAETWMKNIKDMMK